MYPAGVSRCAVVLCQADVKKLAVTIRNRKSEVLLGQLTPEYKHDLDRCYARSNIAMLAKKLQEIQEEDQNRVYVKKFSRQRAYALEVRRRPCCVIEVSAPA